MFIVSTVNLVLQQKERFDYFFGGKYSVGEISGANSTDIPLKYLLQDHNVVVMTAQILVNALNNENKDQRVELKDISLLLFDECHHANKEHPYNNIMGTYLALKSQPGCQHSLPQVPHNSLFNVFPCVFPKIVLLLNYAHTIRGTHKENQVNERTR